MSAITIENDLVHYEVLGRGRPVILLHGWLGSWRYWVPAMQQLSAKYRAYALDLWGFGDSGKDPRRFDFASQVALLDQFMEKMGIGKAALVGHDLGAAVAVRYATLHPDRVPRLLTISPPLFQMAPSLTLNVPAGASRQIAAAASSAASSARAALESANPGAVEPEAETMPWRTEEMRERIRLALEKQAQELGEAALSVEDPAASKPKSPLEATQPPADKPVTEIVAGASAAGTSAAGATKATGTPQPANPLKAHLGTVQRFELLEKHVDAGADRDKLKVEVEKSHEKVIEASVESFAGVDTLRELAALAMPLVVVSGANNSFLPPPTASMQEALKSKPGAFLYLAMEGTRHFPMLENVTGFTRLLLDFLEVPDVRTIEIKKTWERRVR